MENKLEAAIKTKFFDATGVRKGVLYPYILASTKYVSDIHRKNAEVLIVDSDIKNPNETNDVVLMKAQAFKADYVVPKDYLYDPLGTIKSVEEMFKIAKEEWFDTGKVLIPLQPDNKGNYDLCFEGLKDYGNYFGLGGLMPIEDKEKQFRWIKKGANLLKKAGKRIHLFGIYPSRKIRNRTSPLWKWLREGNVESLDSNVPETDAWTGRARDLGLNRYHFINTRGHLSSYFKYRVITLNCWATLIALNRESEKPKSKGISARDLKPKVSLNE